MPGMNCLFFGNSSESCDREVLLETLSSLEVRDVMLDPGDPRGLRLEEYGFERRYGDDLTVVWGVPRFP